jgi:hypothetical protein
MAPLASRSVTPTWASLEPVSPDSTWRALPRKPTGIRGYAAPDRFRPSLRHIDLNIE